MSPVTAGAMPVDLAVELEQPRWRSTCGGWPCPSSGVNDDGRRVPYKTYQVCTERTTPVSSRVSPTEKIRGEIDALFGSGRELSEVLEDVAGWARV
jgi:hypothetical protein